jgi:hypothetical protein
VLSTLSPIKDEKGKVDGILLIMKDITPFLELEVERHHRARAESQNQLRRILTSLLPTLLMQSGAARSQYLSSVLDQVERALLWKDGPLVCDWKKNNPKGCEGCKISKERRKCSIFLADHLCGIMNTLGGSFYWENIEGKDGSGANIVRGRVFSNADCPWGEECKRNPILCNLCKGIFTRLVQRMFDDGRVDLTRTIGKGDDRCVIKVLGLSDTCACRVLCGENGSATEGGSIGDGTNGQNGEKGHEACDGTDAIGYEGHTDGRRPEKGKVMATRSGKEASI